MQNHKPAVWMISSLFYPFLGGGQQQALHLSKKLIQRGWSVQVLTRRHSQVFEQPPSAYELIGDLSVHRMPSRGPGPIGATLFLLTSLLFLLRHRSRRAIFHAHGIGVQAWIAILASLILSGKSIIKLRSGVAFYEAYAQSFLRRAYLYIQFKMANHLIVVNMEVSNYLQETWKIRGDVISLLPNVVDAELFSPLPQERTAALAYGVAAESSVSAKLIYVGRLAPWKGVDTLLEAWSLLPPSTRESAQLLIIGDGPLFSSLVWHAGTLDIKDSVSFLGEQRDIRQFLWQADAFILPSQVEGLSNALLEAMACGVPPICTAVGGANDWIKHGVTGLLVAPDDPPAMSQAIRILLDDEEMRFKIGAAARKSIVDNLTWSVLIPVVEMLYTESVSNSSESMVPTN